MKQTFCLERAFMRKVKEIGDDMDANTFSQNETPDDSWQQPASAEQRQRVNAPYQAPTAQPNQPQSLPHPSVIAARFNSRLIRLSTIWQARFPVGIASPSKRKRQPQARSMVWSSNFRPSYNGVWGARGRVSLMGATITTVVAVCRKARSDALVKDQQRT